MKFTGIVHFPINIQGETAAIGTASELAVALDVLQGQHDRETLVQLRPHLAEIIANASGFMLVMRSLTTEDQRYLIEAIGPDLVSVIQSAVHLRDQLATMADPQIEAVLLETLGTPGLRRLILTAEELAEVLEWVYDQCDLLVLDLLGEDHLRHTCRQAGDLGVILHSLDQSLQERLVAQLGWDFITGLIHDGRELAGMLRALPPASSERLLRHYDRAKLVSLIGNARDWEYLYRRLEPGESEFLLDRLAMQ
jgi:hypothetical protein